MAVAPPRPEALSGCAGNKTARMIERSIHYMNEHINEPLQVATLAAQANVSPSHFFALFKQQMGCPPMDYFTRLRMSHACRLLDSDGARVKEVAAALGYEDPFYFSRVFKSVHNVPPSQYRSAQFNCPEMSGHPALMPGYVAKAVGRRINANIQPENLRPPRHQPSHDKPTMETPINGMIRIRNSDTNLLTSPVAY